MMLMTDKLWKTPSSDDLTRGGIRAEWPADYDVQVRAVNGRWQW